METLNSHTEKIKLIFKQWLRDLIYIFVAIVFTAFLASLNKMPGLMVEIEEYVKYHPTAIDYKWLLIRTLKIIEISARPISFFLIAIFTLSFFYTTLTIGRMLKIDLMFKKDLKPHPDFHYYFLYHDAHYYVLLACFNSIFAGLSSYIGNLWLGGLDYAISIEGVIIFSNFLFSCSLILLILSENKIGLRWLTFSMFLIINSYWILMVFNQAIWILPYYIQLLLLFLFIVIILVVFYEAWKICRCLKR